MSVVYYAVKYLKVRQILVVGHYGCGGVAAAMSNKSFGFLDNWLVSIKNVYTKYQGELDSISDETERTNRLVELNAIEQARNMAKISFIQEEWQTGNTPEIHALVYSLNDGVLRNLDSTFNASSDLKPVFQIKPILMIQEAISQLESLFEPCRNAQRAQTAKAYMKDHFEYIGMPTEVRRSAQKSWIDALKNIDDRNERWNIIRALFEKEERDYHYVAIDWLNTWPKKHFSPNDAEDLKWILSTNCWWDSVDAIASNYLGKWAKLFPDKARETFENWRNSENFWLQRSCLIIN